MKKAAVFVLISLVVSAVICFGDTAFASDKPKFTKHFHESLLNITDKGLFSVEILLNDKEYPKLGKDVIGLVIHDEYDKDVEGADIKITATPKGQAGAGAPVIKDKGDGLYTVSNMPEERRQMGVQDRHQEGRIARQRIFPLPRCFECAIAPREILGGLIIT